MSLKECFTLDIYSRTKNFPGFGFILKNLIFDPGYRVVVYYRLSIFFKRLQFLKLFFYLISKLIIIRLCRVPGVELRTQFDIGEDLKVYHPHDIVIGAGARVGKNVTIFNGVTLGARILKELDETQENLTRYPVVGDGVTIFSGAKIIGPVTVGNNSIVGANSVVNKSFPERSVIAGAPARLITIRKGGSQ
ncbi:MAG: hypothetical protein OS130_11930 [Thermodesulfobacteriota bacterium]|jgi:serine O-acetyltransferase|nr:MAG: hypothetical protein OS130_11930 [Thermodesulfobacteriota bacterium]